MPQERLNADIGIVSFGMDQAWLHAKNNGTGSQFLDQQDHLLSSVVLPDHFSMQRGVVLSKQQPSFAESVAQTIKRLRFLEKFVENAPDSVVGQICGGSMSYGRFYNVRGREDPSDLDLIMVVNPSFFASECDQRKMIDVEKGFRADEADLFQRRCAYFQELYGQGRAQVLSQKFSLDDYKLSLKVVPFSEFTWEFNDVPEKLINERKEVEVSILDYKPAPYSDKNSPRNNFFRDTHVFRGEEMVLPNGEAITQVPVAVFKDGTLYTGDHHNHVVPKFEIQYDPHGETKKVVARFEDLLKKEFLAEVGIRRDSKADILNSMDRLPLLSPQVIQEAQQRFAV